MQIYLHTYPYMAIHMCCTHAYIPPHTHTSTYIPTCTQTYKYTYIDNNIHNI